MHIINLDSSDDIISITDRLDWTGERRVLLVLPPDGGALREGLDLARLRRHADRQRLEVGLVTADAEITRQARALGFPTFLSEAAAEKKKREWWRGRRRREVVGLPTVGGAGVEELRAATRIDEGDRSEMKRRMTPPTSPRRWLLRYAAILLFFVTLALLVVGFAYTVPGAALTLKPEVRPVRVTRQILVDPTIDEVDYRLGAAPGRVLTVVESWQTDVEATGTATLPDASARGQVVFINLLDQEVTIPAGARVSTSEGSNVVFQTLEEVTLPGALGSTAEVTVTAVEPGPQGNVGENLVNRVLGSLATQVEVRNLEPMTGGAVREVTAVSAADQERLRSQVEQFLLAVATSEMGAQLTEREFLAQESLRIVAVEDETYSHFAGEPADELTLAMRGRMQGTAVDLTEASGLVYDALIQDVPAGFELVPDSITFRSGEVQGVDADGRVTLELIGEGVAAANLDLERPLQVVAGQDRQVALAYLYENLPLRDVPTADIWPTWFERMPYLTARIQTEVQVGE